MTQDRTKIPFEEKDLSFWQLSFILSAGFGPVSMMMGAQISQASGAGAAVVSIITGNLILWFIGLGIISMTSERAHSIENIKENLGKLSTIISAIVIVAAFLIWYALQIQFPVEAITTIIGKHIESYKNLGLRVGVGLGFVCALVGMGGIRIIKWVNLIGFPLLFFCLVYFLFQSDEIVSFKGTWGISFVGILMIVLTWLPGTVNLSTFFRHSRSKANSCLGLTLMSILHSLFQCAFVVLNTTTSLSLIDRGKSDAYAMVVAVFLVLSFFCINLLNIYWASVGWEVFSKQKQGLKSYAMIGLIGTMIYVFFQSTAFITFMEGLGTAFIANLGIILITSYFLKLIVHHRPRYIDKLSNSICWFFGCLVAMLILLLDSKNVVHATLTGMSASLVIFCIIMFIEEVTWSIKNLPKS